MKLSVFTTSTDCNKRGDNLKDALRCYTDLADETICIDGSYAALDGEGPNGKRISHRWPKEFSWEFIGQQFQRGYEACTGDVVIHADLDFIFHEKDFESIRKVAKKMLANAWPAVSMYKYQFILPDRFNLKSRLVVMVNKRDFDDRIRFDSGGDLAQPSFDGRYIDPNNIPEAQIGFYNYEKMTKTEAQVRDDVERMARAWHRHFGDYHLGTDETAYDEWLRMVVGRFQKPQEFVPWASHPKYVQETIRQLEPQQFGYDGFGNLERNKYAESYISSRQRKNRT